MRVHFLTKVSSFQGLSCAPWLFYPCKCLQCICKCCGKSTTGCGGESSPDSTSSDEDAQRRRRRRQKKRGSSGSTHSRGEKPAHDNRLRDPIDIHQTEPEERLKFGSTVEIFGLRSSRGTLFNGCTGRIVDFDTDAARYAVEIEAGVLKYIKRHNLKLSSPSSEPLTAAQSETPPW